MDGFNSGNNGMSNENSETHVNDVQVDDINTVEKAAPEGTASVREQTEQAAAEAAPAAEGASLEEVRTEPAPWETTAQQSSINQETAVQAEQAWTAQAQAAQAQASSSADQTVPAAAQTTQSAQGAPAYTNGTYQARPQSYYNESIKKTKANKAGAGQLILVAVLGALIGAGLMFAASLFLAPVIQPAIDSLTGKSAQTSEVATAGNNGVYKKVEITQSSTPVEAISEKVSPSIVGIKVTVQSQGSGFFFDQSQDGVGEGSGIIIKDNGYILTNNHVVDSALEQNSNKISEGSKIEVILPNNTKKTYVAKVIGRDSKTDIAVLKIEAANLPVAELGDSDKVKSGELAVAIGNPAGLDYMGSITAGIISGINRSITMENGEVLKLIQTDAAINPGNSGGALVNSQGQVIGVNTVKIAATGYEGLGFAIPINEANNIAKSLIDYKYVKGRPYLGVSIDQRFNADVAKQYNVPNGLLVYDVLPLSSAYKAGIKAGDIITKFDGKTVTEFQQLEDQKNTHKPGDVVKIEVYRDGKTLTLTAKLDEEKNTD